MVMEIIFKKLIYTIVQCVDSQAFFTHNTVELRGNIAGGHADCCGTVGGPLGAASGSENRTPKQAHPYLPPASIGLRALPAGYQIQVPSGLMTVAHRVNRPSLASLQGRVFQILVGRHLGIWRWGLGIKRFSVRCRPRVSSIPSIPFQQVYSSPYSGRKLQFWGHLGSHLEDSNSSIPPSVVGLVIAVVIFQGDKVWRRGNKALLSHPSPSPSRDAVQTLPP